MSHRLASVLVAALLLGACAPGDASSGAGKGDTAARVEQVRALRELLAGPAVALGRAGAQVEREVRALRTEPASEPADRLASVAVVQGGAVAGLTGALADARQVAVSGDGQDAAATGAAWDATIAAADALVDAAQDELDLVGALATTDGALAEVVAVWAQPGSRSQQLAAFADAAAVADRVAEDLSARPVDVPCLGDQERRIAAATFVAAATRELRRYVANHQGNAFDARRAELDVDPYGLGGPLAAVDDPSCWDDGSRTGAAATRLRAALAGLEEALNPPELEGGADA